MSLMFETISNSKSSHEQIEAFNGIQKFVSVLSDSEALQKSFHAFCQSVCVEDDTWSFWSFFCNWINVTLFKVIFVTAV